MQEFILFITGDNNDIINNEVSLQDVLNSIGISLKDTNNTVTKKQVII